MQKGAHADEGAFVGTSSLAALPLGHAFHTGLLPSQVHRVVITSSGPTLRLTVPHAESASTAEST